jgi:hypothetical protein
VSVAPETVTLAVTMKGLELADQVVSTVIVPLT